MKRTIMRGAVALALVAGIFAATAHDAEARRGRNIGTGIFIGTLLGLGIAGAYGAPRYYDDDGPYCYRGPRQCDYVGRSCWYNRYGERVCREGKYRCWRPTVCDD
jgi:hypothetical protein